MNSFSQSEPILVLYRTDVRKTSKIPLRQWTEKRRKPPTGERNRGLGRSKTKDEGNSIENGRRIFLKTLISLGWTYKFYYNGKVIEIKYRCFTEHDTFHCIAFVTPNTVPIENPSNKTNCVT